MDMSTSSFKQRRFRRVAATCLVEAQGAFAFTREIGLGGMFLESDQSWALNTRFDCALHLSDTEGPMEVACVVRYVTRRGVGLEFVERPPAGVQALRSFIAAQDADIMRDTGRVLAELDDVAHLEQQLGGEPAPRAARNPAELERMLRRRKQEELERLIAAAPDGAVALDLPLRPGSSDDLGRAAGGTARVQRLSGARPRAVVPIVVLAMLALAAFVALAFSRQELDRAPGAAVPGHVPAVDVAPAVPSALDSSRPNSRSNEVKQRKLRKSKRGRP
jgi:hypothetical protein